MIKKTIKAFGINEYKACISKNTKVATCKIDGAQIVWIWMTETDVLEIKTPPWYKNW